MRAAAALLAAGTSRRLGRPKALLELAGVTFLRRLAGELAAVADPLLVVLPSASPSLERELVGLPAIVVPNPDPGRGMGSSLALAARHAEARCSDADALLLALVDQPLADRSLFAELLAAARGGWAACDYGEAIGPPVVFPRSAWSELTTLTGDRGARHLIERERPSVALVEFPGGRYDVDTLEDLARLTKLGGGTGEGS